MQDGNFHGRCSSIAIKAFSREQLVEISQWLLDNPSLLLAEISRRRLMKSSLLP
jgi:hypothetical protein